MAVTTWLAQLKPASFRGVSFQIDSIDVSAGENLVLQEYPFQDLPSVTRMGEAAELVRVSAYVVGPDYQAQRENLRAALHNVPANGGELVHPTAGTMRVHVAEKYSIKEAPISQGCVVRFDITFVRAQVRVWGEPVPDPSEQAKEAAQKARDAALDEFEAGFKLAGAPGWVQARVVTRVSASLEKAWDGLQVATRNITDLNDQAVGAFQVLRNGMQELVRTPRAFAGAVNELFALPGELTAATGASFRGAFEGLFDLGSNLPNNAFEVSLVTLEGLVMAGMGDGDALTRDTAAQKALADLQAQSDRLFETLALAAWVEVVASVDLDGYDQALALRSRVKSQCTGMLMRASHSQASQGLASSSWYDSVTALLGASLNDLLSRSRDLARLTTYTPTHTTSIWLVSYELYGTTEWADEIWSMNPGIEHPMLVPPGRELRVVRHD